MNHTETEKKNLQFCPDNGDFSILDYSCTEMIEKIETHLYFIRHLSASTPT